jgi:thioredoxin reductase (NADPH)
MLVRGSGLSSTMSRYLIDRIAASPNIALLCDTEVVELLGTPDQGLRGLRWRNRRTGAEEQHAIAHLFLFTGADPAAGWLTGCGIPLDEKGFIRTGADGRRPSECRCRWRRVSRGSSPSATSVAAR